MVSQERKCDLDVQRAWKDAKGKMNSLNGVKALRTFVNSLYASTK
jgi:hypothetical protein